MADAVRNGRITLLRLSGKVFAAVLSLVGILSCSSGNPEAPPTYGPPSPGLYVWGQISSANDSSRIAGIEVKLTSTDSLYDYEADTTYSIQYYGLYMGEEYYPWSDSVRLVATDIDGDLNGSYLSRDTLLFIGSLEYEYDYLDLNVDLYLEDAAK